MIEWITNIDKNILLFLQEHLRNGVFNPIMIFITYLGDGGIMWIVASLAMTAFKKTRKAGIMALLALALGFIVTNLILKNCFERVRPYDQFQDLILLIRKSEPHPVNSDALIAVTANKAVSFWNAFFFI